MQKSYISEDKTPPRIILVLPGESALEARSRLSSTSVASTTNKGGLRRSGRIRSASIGSSKSTNSTTSQEVMEANLRSLFTDLQETLNTPACRVVKLTGKNYPKWKRDMTLYLRSADLWTTVVTDVPAGAGRDARWTRKNDKALVDIHNSCDSDQQDLIMEYNRAKDAWDKLKEIYETDDAPAIQRSYNEFNNIRKKKDESMATYIARVNAAARALIAVQETVSDRNIMNRMIEGLGPDYESLKVGLSLIEDLTLKRLTSALLGDESRKALEHDQKRRLRSASPKAVKNEDNRYRDRNQQSGAQQPAASTARKGIYCPKCDMYNHTIDTCFVEHPELLRRRQQYRGRIAASQQGNQQRGRTQGSTVARSTAVTEVAAVASEVNAAYASPQTYVQSTQGKQSTQNQTSSAQHQAMLTQEQRLWDYWDHAMTVQTLDPVANLHRHEFAMINVDDRNLCYANTKSNTVGIKSGDYVQMPPKGSWLMDSGASNHYTSNKSILSDFAPCEDCEIMTGNGLVVGKGMGNVTLHTSVGVRKLFDVMWVPELSGNNNLLSIPQLVKKGCKVALTTEHAVVTDKDNNCLALGTFMGKGWFLEMAACTASMQVVKVIEHEIMPANAPKGSKPVKRLIPTVVHEVGIKTSMPDIAMMAGVTDTQPVEVWHMRLGHLNQRSVVQLVSRSIGMVIGPARPQTISMNCEPCLRGAQHKTISRMRGPGASKILQHVWTDVKGPLLDKDIYGFRFFVTFIDEFTRYTVVVPLLQKSDVFNAFKLFEARAERVANAPIVNLHCDGGGEYLSNEFRAYARNKGIHVLITQPYGPEMNSLSERMMRMIIEHASAMLWAAKLPIGFWAPAVKTAVFLYNRSPHSSLPGEMTPYEAWHNSAEKNPNTVSNKPHLGHLKVFGCRASAHVPDELRTKSEWTSKASPDCVFIGYSETQNLFDLWDCKKNDVIRKRDVVFWEHEMGHPDLSGFALPHGVSIFSGVASKIVESFNDEAGVNDVVSLPVQPQNNLPLVPLAGRQNIEALPRENEGDELTFIHYEHPANANAIPIPVVRKPVLDLPHVAKYMETIYTLDDLFMNEMYVADLISKPVSEPSCVEAVEPFWIPAELNYVTVVPFDDKDLPLSLKQALRHPRADRWKKAMEKQLKSLEENGTWELVDLPKGRKAFPNKWVYDWVRAPKVMEENIAAWRKELLEKGMKESDWAFKEEMNRREKEHGGLERVEKARLVARGDLQKEGLDYHDTFAPVVKFVSLRVLLVRAARLRLETRHWDIVSAFLHGDMDVDTYMQQPQGYSDGTNRVCHLRKAIYGLCQAARQFYLKLDEILKKVGYIQLSCDWAIWIGSKEFNTENSFVAVHVDDMAAAGTNAQLQRLKAGIEEYLAMKDLGPITLYLGIAIDYDMQNGTMFLSQGDYTRKILDEYAMSSAHPVATPMLEQDREVWDKEEGQLLQEKEKKRYQALVGSLLYLMHGTRPDICYAVIRLSQYASKPKQCHWEGLKRVLQYLKGTSDAAIVLGNRPRENGAREDVLKGVGWKGLDDPVVKKGLVGYFDSAHADNLSRRSTCGYLFLLHGSPISWASKIQRTVALSTTEAEYMAGTEATREAIWIRGLLHALTKEQMGPTLLRGDNQGALALAKNPVFHQRTKHIDIRHRFISECVESKVIEVEYVNTKEMLADSLTKPLPKDIYVEHVRGMGIVNGMQNDGKKRKFSCSHCGNLFKDAESLKKHMMTKES